MHKDVIAKKAKKVDEVAKDFNDSASAIVVDYRGLTVANINDLRKQLRDEGISFSVIKNKILERVADKNGIEDLKDLFQGPSAVAFSPEDPITPTKILKKFSDEIPALTIKGGIVDGKIASVEEINTFATLPSREELLATLASMLQSPIRSVAYAVKAVADKKAEEDSGEETKEASTETSDKPADKSKETPENKDSEKTKKTDTKETKDSVQEKDKTSEDSDNK